METDIFSGKKFLLVEDQESISSMYKKFFERSGAEVMVAPRGTEALEILKDHTFDLVFLDRNLSPDMDGFQVLEHIRQNEKTKNTAVVILSNLALKDDEIAFIEKHNVAGYYSKADISLNVLEEAVASIVREG